MRWQQRWDWTPHTWFTGLLCPFSEHWTATSTLWCEAHSFVEGAEKGRAASLVLNKGHGHEGTSQTSQSLCWQELCQAQQRQEVGTCQALQGMWLGGGTTSPGETAVHGLGDCETSATNGQEAEPGQLRDRKCQAGPAPVCPPVSAVPVLLAAEMKEA